MIEFDTVRLDGIGPFSADRVERPGDDHEHGDDQGKGHLEKGALNSQIRYN